MRPLSFLLLLALGNISTALLGSVNQSSEGSRMRKPLPPLSEISKLPADGGAEFNRLIFEQSPYLLQHARNAVDWHAWNEASFEQAKKENKPIFLSIGYSTCHWCHVMEHESFEDEDVAALLNKNFISIKVDREERPDVDKIYMDATQAMTGRGGWPMTVIMTPERKPFFTGTYFPKESQYGRPGLIHILGKVWEGWQNDRENIDITADRVIEVMKEMNESNPNGSLGADTLTAAFKWMQSSFDSTYGGFGESPKFPIPHNHSFLLRYWNQTKDEGALNMVRKTLTEMKKGGVYDQIGFGFHRYSTDEKWLLPHFEKMLYDQALLAVAYLEAFQVTGESLFSETAREIFTYVLRDMTDPEGGFYSAEDADSEGVEGKFYVWEPKELKEILGEAVADRYMKWFNVEEGGNFYDQALRSKTGESILHLQRSLEEIALEEKMEVNVLRGEIEVIRKKLFTVREKRIHPYKDDKILVDWNGLMIAALARGYQVFNDEKYVDAAKKSADFILKNMKLENGSYLKRHRKGVTEIDGQLEDYAFLMWGLIELYEAVLEVEYLEEAISIANYMGAHFWDSENGGFFMTADNSEQLVVRGKDVYDGAIPSGNSVAALGLIKLSRITGNLDYAKKSELIFKSFAGNVERSAASHSFLLQALDMAVNPAKEIVLVGNKNSSGFKKMLDVFRSTYRPSDVLVYKPELGDRISKSVPFVETMIAIDGKATAYVCSGFACDAPVNDVESLKKLLAK